jgi:LPPG:FO 2-phospho-L-lactate transferase
MKVVALAGGVGGAKLVAGLSKILPEDSLTVIVNTGDDFDHLGLRICPDLDTVCYTLAGLANSTTGWGRVEETWNAMQSLEQLGGPNWFRLGDRDLGTHLERTRLLSDGWSLSEVIEKFCETWGITQRVLPMSNDRTPTLVDSDEGQLAFQDYFVRRKCEPHVSGFHFAGIELAHPAPNIHPILPVPYIKYSIFRHHLLKQVVAVSPIIAGEAVKGPAAKMYLEMGIEPSAKSVAQHYDSQIRGGMLTGYVFDNLDADQNGDITDIGLATYITNTLMKTTEDRVNLAKEVMTFGENLIIKLLNLMN